MRNTVLSTLLLSLPLLACDSSKIEERLLEASESEARDHFGVSLEEQFVPAYGPLETVATFDPAALEAPESVALDRDGNAYVVLALTGAIVKVAPNGTKSTLATLPLGAPPLTPCNGPFPAILGAITIDLQDNLYVNVASCDLASRGVWRVKPNGSTNLVASLPPDALPNGIEIRGQFLYIADSGAGRIWFTPKNGSGSPATVWASSDLLNPVPNPFGAPGSNGIQFYRGSFYVANSSANTIVEVPQKANGTPGIASVKHQLDIGCDDFAFDIIGGIWCTTDPFQTVQYIDPAGNVEVVYTAADNLDGPTAAVFGKGIGNLRTLYITNAQFPFFQPTGNGPSLQKTQVSIPGYSHL